MTVASNSNNATALTLNTPATLATITTAGVYVLGVDVNVLVADDVLRIRANLKVRSAGTTRLLNEWVLGPLVPPEKVFITYPIASTNELSFVLEQTAGTGHTWPWEIWVL